MKKEIKLAVVGYSRGYSLLKLAHGIGGIKITAICDIASASLQIAKENWPEAGHFKDFDEMLEKTSIDALLIETPAQNHAEFAIKALERNIHVMSDIPVVWTVEEAKRLWKAEQESKAIFMTGANANLKCFIDTAVDLKKKGLLGDPYYIECEYLHDCRALWKKTPWRVNIESIQYCTHSLGPVLRVIEEPFEYVSCFDTGSHINKAEGQHDAMVALLRTRSNVVVRLLISFINDYCDGGHHFRFFTTKGCFERTPRYATYSEKNKTPRTLWYSTEMHGNKNWMELPADIMPLEYASDPKAQEYGHGGIDYAMLDKFFKAIREELPSPISLKEGLEMTLPGTFAAKSAANGGELTKITYPWNE